MDCRTHRDFVQKAVVVPVDIGAVADTIVVFVDRDIVAVTLVDWDWGKWDIDAMCSVECFPMAVVRIFGLDQWEGDYYLDNSMVD